VVQDFGTENGPAQFMSSLFIENGALCANRHAAAQQHQQMDQDTAMTTGIATATITTSQTIQSPELWGALAS